MNNEFNEININNNCTLIEKIKNDAMNIFGIRGQIQNKIRRMKENEIIIDLKTQKR